MDLIHLWTEFWRSDPHVKSYQKLCIYLKMLPWSLLLGSSQMKDICYESWLSQESEPRKPNWFLRNKLFSSRKFIKELKSNFCKMFLKMGEREADLQLSTICLPPFLWTEIMFDLFPILEKILLSIKFLKIIGNSLTIDTPQSLIIWTDMTSWPCALIIVKSFTIFSMSSSLNEMRIAL